MKRKNLSAKLLSLVLALALALCCLPAASAQEKEITIDFSFYNGNIVIPKTELEVTDGIAEEYGYSLADKENITVFDAIVAAHISLYGEKFTKETCGDYLEMSASFITKAFGAPSSALGFFVNDKMPHNGIYDENFYGYTGYACDTAAIKSNDYVSLFTYQDLSMYADYYITLSDSEISVETQEEFTVSATGYSAMWYGCSLEETIEANTYPMAGVDVYSTTDFELYSKVGTLDENGEITLSFSNPGTVYLCFMGKFEDMYAVNPVIANWCEVTVSEPITEPPTEQPDNNPSEPDYKDAMYVPNDIDVLIDADSEKGAVTVTLRIDFTDINKAAPAKSEFINFSINVSWFSRIIEFISGVLK